MQFLEQPLVQIINQHKYLYLDEIGEPKDNSLRLVIEEAGAEESAQDMQLPGGIMLPNARQIVSDESCSLYAVYFDTYVIYSVRNESYVVTDNEEVYLGSKIGIYSKSHFLDYMSRAVIDPYDEKSQRIHYEINCPNHIISIISTREPTIERLR